MNKIFAAVFGLLFFIFNLISNHCDAYTADGILRVTMLNVGQGDAFLLETSEQNILIDTGDDKNKIIAELNKAGISRLDRVILTHPHADHIGAIQAVIDNCAVLEILDNGIVSTSPFYIKYRSANIPCTNIEAGDTLNLGDKAYFKVLHPDTFLVNCVNSGVQRSKPNNESIVGRLTFGNFSMLFTGDVEKTVEEDLIAQNIKSTILKAGHHGSRTSSSANFVANVQPQFVFISAGKHNRFKHPHKKPLEIYRVNGVKPENIYCTAFNGTVVAETDGTDITITPEIASSWVERYTGEVIIVTDLD